MMPVTPRLRGNRPLFKTEAPPLTPAERLHMVQEARRALAEEDALLSRMKVRGILALYKAEERIASRLRAETGRGTRTGRGI